MANKSVWIDRMTSPNVRDAIAAGNSTVLLAVGSTEQHGPHLPTGTDSLIGDHLMEEIARRLGNALVAPTIRVGASEHHMAYAGSMTLREEVLEEVIVDCCRSLARHGFKMIVVIPTHGGNTKTVLRTSERLARESLSSRAVTLPDDSAYVTAMVEVGGKLDITPGEAGSHAGHLETSLMLACLPDTVDMSKAARGLVEIDSNAEERLHEIGMHRLSPIGILGDATKSTAEAGRDYMACMADALAKQIQDLQREHGV